MDLWGNIKIPDLQHLIKNTTKNSTGWFDVSKQSNITYSSLLGLPVSGIPDTDTTEFTLDFSYMTLNCLNSSTGSLINFTENVVPGSDVGMYFGVDTTNSNTFKMALNGFLDDESLYSTSNWDARTLLFQSETSHQDFVRIFCTVTTTYLESSVICRGSDCQVAAIRPSSQQGISSQNPNITNWSTWNAFSEFSYNFEGIVNNLSGDAPVGSGVVSTATEMYLQDPSLVPFTYSVSAADLSKIDLDTVGIRLQ